MFKIIKLYYDTYQKVIYAVDGYKIISNKELSHLVGKLVEISSLSETCFALKVNEDDLALPSAKKSEIKPDDILIDLNFKGFIMYHRYKSDLITKENYDRLKHRICEFRSCSYGAIFLKLIDDEAL